jgi:hypothetical protein
VRAHGDLLRGECARNVSAEKAGGTGDENPTERDGHDRIIHRCVLRVTRSFA